MKLEFSLVLTPTEAKQYGFSFVSYHAKTKTWNGELADGKPFCVRYDEKPEDVTSPLGWSYALGVKS